MLWRVRMNIEHLREHGEWMRRGKTGTGRLVVEDLDLRVAELKYGYAGARFVRCDFRGQHFRHPWLDETEFVDCKLDDVVLSWVDLRRARIEHSSFRNANLVFGKLDAARIQGGSFWGANLQTTQWWSVRANGVDFRRASFPMVDLDNAIFDNCDFGEAQLVRGDPRVDGGTAANTLFIECDFTRADLSGLELRRTRFERCKLAQVIGKPNIREPIELVDNDVPAAKLLSRWGAR